ncbi:hypothetical protein [Parvularcula sp. LCG005]|uniref:hypothetical protein n=1 Tax=Parvularcula sp. LCG005 TaxID=3078805 RepID=UPI002942B821|nr:hypothetical protein [Parvularcula sp. LCG005]WOI54505.1 hypothetical protein RUI03_05755 [Parvularcula sp. LCG005]
MDDGMQIWAETKATTDLRLSGFTAHIAGGSRVEDAITRLRIVSFPPDTGFYLLYFDECGNELTDTLHETLADALDQAKREFDIDLAAWDFFDPVNS